MLWDQLGHPWKVCVQEAWTAYQAGSLPIGAAIVDGAGRVIGQGRNRFHEIKGDGGALFGHRLAHAEMNALLSLDWHTIIASECALYTTSEPCPLCVGAIRMTRLGAVHFAARDGSAGCVDLFDANPYMRRGQISIHPPHLATFEIVLVAMLVEFGRAQGDENAALWVDRLGESVPAGLRVGHALAASGDLRRWAETGRTAEEVVEELASMV